VVGSGGGRRCRPRRYAARVAVWGAWLYLGHGSVALTLSFARPDREGRRVVGSQRRRCRAPSLHGRVTLTRTTKGRSCKHRHHGNRHKTDGGRRCRREKRMIATHMYESRLLGWHAPVRGMTRGFTQTSTDMEVGSPAGNLRAGRRNRAPPWAAPQTACLVSQTSNKAGKVRSFPEMVNLWMMNGPSCRFRPT